MHVKTTEKQAESNLFRPILGPCPTIDWPLAFFYDWDICTHTRISLKVRLHLKPPPKKNHPFQPTIPLNLKQLC